jgi:hypothetical protein
MSFRAALPVWSSGTVFHPNSPTNHRKVTRVKVRLRTRDSLKFLADCISRAYLRINRASHREYGTKKNLVESFSEECGGSMR